MQAEKLRYALITALLAWVSWLTVELFMSRDTSDRLDRLSRRIDRLEKHVYGIENQ